MKMNLDFVFQVWMFFGNYVAFPFKFRLYFRHQASPLRQNPFHAKPFFSIAHVTTSGAFFHAKAAQQQVVLSQSVEVVDTSVACVVVVAAFGVVVAVEGIEN